MKTLLSKEELRTLPQLPDPKSGSWYGYESNGQTIGVRVFTPATIRDEKQIVIDPIAYSVHASTPRDVQRTSAIADATGLITIALEQPGISPFSGPLTNEQLRDISNGDWSSLGQVQWDASLEALRAQGIDTNDLIVHYTAFSMGVSSAIGMIQASPEGVKTGHAILWEGVAFHEPIRDLNRAKKLGKRTIKLAQLVGGMLHGALKLKKYQAYDVIQPNLNDQLDKEFRPKVSACIPNKIKSWVAPVWGMTAGGDAEKLAASLSKNQPESATITLINGEKSKLSRTRAVGRAALILSGVGTNVVHESDIDGRHGVEDSLTFSANRYAELLNLYHY